MNKKLLSVAAAGILAAGLVGCGGGGGSSSTSSSSTDGVTGVDGYVMNAKVVVTYLDDQNKTQTYTLDPSNSDTIAKSFYLSVDAKNGGKAREGVVKYSLADLNQTVRDRMLTVALTTVPAGVLADGSRYPASFFDANGNKIYDSDDLVIPAGTTLEAPVGYSIVTPISTIIAAKVKAEVTADPTKEANLTNIVNNYTDKVAKALGVDSTILKNVDPLTLKNSQDPKVKAYIIANAFAGALVAGSSLNSTTATTLLNNLTSAPEAKSATDVIKNLKNAVQTVDTTLATALTQLEAQVASDVKNLDKIVKANLDKTRDTSVVNGDGTLTITGLETSKADFNLTDINQTFGANGYKLQPSDLNGTSSNKVMRFAVVPNDTNISNKDLKFVIRVANAKAYNAADANVSEVVIELPFEINSTDGKVNVNVPADAIVKVEGVNNSGELKKYTDLNASALGVDGTNVISANNGVIRIDAKGLVDAVDNNTSILGGSGYPNKIVQIQAGIVADSNVLAPVDSSGNGYFVPSTTISSPASYISESVLSMINFNTNKDMVADSRANDYTGPNKAPNNDLNLTVDGFVGSLAGTLNKGSDTNNSTGRKIVNNNTSLDINLTASTVNSYEENTTVTWTLGSYLTDKNLTGVSTKLKADSSTDAVVSDAIDVNTTSTAADTNLTTYITYKVCDEFGECNTTTAYLVVNRAAYDLNDTNLSEYGIDANGSLSNTTPKEMNITTLTLLDYDDFAGYNSSNADVNFTTSPNLDWTNKDDVNVTVDAFRKNKLVIDLNGSDASGAEINLSFNYAGNGEWNLTLDTNDSNWTVNSSSGLDINITGVNVQAKDKFGLTKTLNTPIKIHLDSN